MNCTACQSAVPDGSRFCPYCGVVITPASPPREMRKFVTVLFCDMVDSTALSGRLDPESLREVMVRYYALMRECLERHGGTVEKFIGDAVVAVFGVPVLHEDDARRALSAATEMIRAVESLNDELRALVGVEIGVRIGVNTGEVVAAEDAASGQVLAAGEAMNVAARLQQHAGPGQIVLGPTTWLLTERDSVFVPLGKLTLKGVAEPVPAWRLAELRPPGTGDRPDSDLPFVGRQTELDELARIFDRSVQAAGCQFVILHGDAGVGKSRLAAEFAARAASRGALVGAGRCRPYGEGAPLHALGEALRQVIAGAGVRDQAAGRDFSEALAYLESGLLLDGSPGKLPGQLTWAVTEILAGAGHPVLLILDDLHKAKPVLYDTLRQVAARITGTAVVILGAGRPELAEEAGLATATLLPLAPLSTDDSRLLVASLGEVTAHRSPLAEEIVERAGGNPFFLEQLVAISGPQGADTLPATVRSVIAARIDLLQPMEQDVLLRAAVPGVRFSAPELGAVLVVDPAIEDPPEEALRPLTRRRLIIAENTADAYRFSGMLVRDVAYDTLPKRDRLRYHEALAGWYGQQSRSADLAGLHLERAYRLAAELHPAHQQVRRLRAEAARALGSAGVRALRRSDLHWAADLLAQAFELYEEDSPDRVAISVHLAEARMLLGTDPRAQQTLRGLARDASAAGDRRTAAHAHLLLAALEMPGPSAIDDALATVPVFEAAGDHLGLARAWLRVAQLRQLGGRYAEAEELLRRALGHALQADMELELATVIGGLATSLWRGPVPAEEAVDRCRMLLAEYGDGRRAVRAAVNCPHAVLLSYRGQHTEARSLVKNSIQIINDLGHAYGATTMMIFAANVEGLAGRWDQAEALLREAAASGQRHGDTLTYSAAISALARARLEGSRDGALNLPDEGTVTGDPFLDADSYGVRARILAARGDRDQAMQAILRAAAEAGVTDSTACQATVELDRAHVLRTLGDEAAAAAAARGAASLFRRKGHLVGAGWASSFGEAS